MIPRFIKIIAVGLLAIGGLIGLTQNVGFTILIESTPKQTDSGALFVRIYQQKNGWGYEIADSGNVFIRQPFIPAASGYKTFRSESEALKTGKLVLWKIKQGQRPAISADELDSLGIKIR